jgi:hypothetical protein
LGGQLFVLEHKRDNLKENRMPWSEKERFFERYELRL